VRFVPTPVAGAFLVKPELLPDERGFFARTWCREEFASHGLCAELSQCSISFNRSAGTLRGLHYQQPPHAEAKLVRVTRGALFDVALDLREDSPTHRRHAAVVLTAENRHMLYVPEGCAHGFLTLEDDTEVLYHISVPYRPQAARGVRYDDPAFAIRWPRPVVVIAERDRTFADFGPALSEVIA
jgi:dTDP-4-dehydrorhamnose 3,5-epimerase